jgi:hypothetical protein
MTHWQDNGAPTHKHRRGERSRVDRRAHPPGHVCGTRVLATWGQKDDDFFRLFFEIPKKPKAVIILDCGKRSSSPWPGLRGDEPRKPEGPFSPQAASPAPPRAPACKQKGSPSPPPRSAARFSACCHIPVLCPAKQIFLFSCRHRSPLFPGTSKVVPTSDRDDSPKCRSCRHTNPHFTGTSKVVPTLVVTLSGCRVQPRLYNQPSRMSSLRAPFHGYFQGAAKISFPATRAKSQNVQPEMETSIPQALLTAHVAKTSMAQALPLPPRGPTSRRKGSPPTVSSRPDSFRIARHQHLSTRPAYTRKSPWLLGLCDVQQRERHRHREGQPC